MVNKEIQPAQETPPPKTEAWLIDAHSFYNGFWNDKQETFETTIINQEGEKTHCQSGQWKLQHQGETIAEAISCVFSDTGLPWIKINFAPDITSEKRQALESSLKHYGAMKAV